jgi:myosin-5
VDYYKKLNIGLENKIISLQRRVDELVREVQSLHSHETEFAAARVEIEKSREQLAIAKQSAIQVSNLTKELEKVKEERDHFEMRVTELESSLEVSNTKYEEEINLLQEKLKETAENLANEQEKHLLDSHSEEAHVTDAVSKERARLMSEFEAERQHHQHAVKEHTRLTQRLENMTEELELVANEKRRLEALQGSEMSVRSEECSRAGSVDNVMDDASESHVSEMQLIFRLKSKIRELEENRPGHMSPDVEERLASLESEKATLEQRLEMLDISSDVSERLVSLETENAALKEQLEQNSSGSDVQRKMQSLEAENLTLREQLEKTETSPEELKHQITLLTTENERLKSEASNPISVSSRRYSIAEVVVDDEQDAVQQITALKDANHLLQSELEAVQSKAKEDVAEIMATKEKLHKEFVTLQKQITRRGTQNVTGIDQKLQQEVTRLTVENLDLREENEQLTARLKEQKAPVNAAQPEIADGGPVTEKMETAVFEVVEPQFMGMFEFQQQDEARLLRKLIIDLNLASVEDCLPGLPAHVLFMCLRYCDHIGDELRIESLLTGIITNVRKVVQKHQTDDGIVAFWFANTCRFLQNMKQYSGEQVLAVQDPETLQSQSLKNFDLTEYRLVISDLAVHIYQCLVKVEQDRMQPMIVSGLLEYESIPGVSHSKPFGMRNVGGKGKTGSSRPGAGAYTVESVIKELSRVLETLSKQFIDPQLVRQIFRQVDEHFSYS